MLLEQVKQAELDLGEARRTNTALISEKQRVDDAIERLQLETDSTGRALKAAIVDKEKQLVDHDVLKLQVHRLRQLLSMHADEVYSLESRKAQLKLSLDERRHEIEVHRDGLRAELKLVREDIHRLTLELRDRQQKVDVLATKFETLASKNRATDPDGGEPKSQAYYIIKAAQEREELQVAGDALDARITTAEAEVGMLSNTLSHMQATNVAFSSSLRQGDTKAALQQRNALREQLDASYDKLKLLRQQEAALLAELQQQQAAGSSSEAELAGMQAIVDDLARKKADTYRQVEEQQEKQGRAMRAVLRAQKLLAMHASMAHGGSAVPGEGGSGRGSSAAGSSRANSAAGPAAAGDAGDVGGAVHVEELQQDVQLAEVRLVTRTMLQELAMLVQQHPDAAIAEALEAAGFKLPTSSNPSSRAGSKAASLAGSRTASRAGSINSQPSAASIGASSVASRYKGPQQQQQQQLNRPGSSSGRIAAVKTMTFGS
ncbi:hypothetical protein COO60DRAFT_1139442 [Scenedesmus sp. NREL 46B-D3]|nr:hypothetical protein COO60DRAFT_1139442 [Scenedesmus sp. NREL 46B-D3]